MTDRMTPKQLNAIIDTLRTGDEVEARLIFEPCDEYPAGESLTLRGSVKVDGRYVDTVTRALRVQTADRRLVSLRVIKRADPGCPFVVGQAVRFKPNGSICIVRAAIDEDTLDAWFVRSGSLHRGCFPPDFEPIPEPPVGTPVWWGAKWMVGYPDGERIIYRRLDTIRRMNDPVWSNMLGAIPAEIPGGAK